MATLAVRLTDLATRIATECKSLRTLINGNAAGLTALTTTAKSNLVAAINELDADITALAAGGGAPINDSASTGSAATWSITKIAAEIALAKTQLSNGASTALDTLAELAAAINNDASYAATVTAALGNRVRIDAAQTLTAPQLAQVSTNLNIGTTDTDFVSGFNTGLV